MAWCLEGLNNFLFSAPLSVLGITLSQPGKSQSRSSSLAWSGRSLSLQGKTTIINVLALSQIWHLCHVFPIPKWASKRIITALWSFFWSGKKDIVACYTVCLPKSRGGFGVIDFERKAESFALQWVKRFFSPRKGQMEELFTIFYYLLLAQVAARGFSTYPSKSLDECPSPFLLYHLSHLACIGWE